MKATRSRTKNTAAAINPADRRRAPGRRAVEPARSAAALRPGPRSGLLAGARARLAAVAGVDPATLGSAVLAASLLPGLRHGRNLAVVAVSGSRAGRARSPAGPGRSRESAPRRDSRRAPPRGSGRPTRPRPAGRRRRRPAPRPARPRRPAGRRAGSWTLVETWARPPERTQPDRPHAGEPAARLAQLGGDRPGQRPSPPSSTTLKAASGGRAVTSVAPALGCGAGGPSRGPARRAPSAVAAPPARRGGRRRARGAPGRWPARRRRRPARRARRSPRRRRGPRRGRHRDRPGSSQTTGQTSRAPTQG